MRLNPSFAATAAADELARMGRVSILNVLDDSTCRQLKRGLENDTPWSLAFNDKGRDLDIDQVTARAMQPQLRMALAKRLNNYGVGDFQYVFDSCRVSDLVDAGKPCPSALEAFYRFINSAPMLDFWRDLTGDTQINYLDLQATRYRPGHFLTTHDDDAPGKGRRFAFVFGLSPVWRLDWGGLLMFSDQSGAVTQCFTPSWNQLNVLKVAQPHSVSMVTPAAVSPRLSLTGWMRVVD